MSWAAVSVRDSLSTMTTAETLPPPLSTGTSVGAPSRTRLLRENSILNGVFHTRNAARRRRPDLRSGIGGSTNHRPECRSSSGSHSVSAPETPQGWGPRGFVACKLISNIDKLTPVYCGLDFLICRTMEFQREIAPAVLRLAAHFPSVVVTGARQTGKTTLLTRLFPRYHYISLDLPQQAQLAEEDPGSFLLRHPAPLLVDEVQYAPKLFRYLKVEIDRNRDANGRFILTGSQKFSPHEGSIRFPGGTLRRAGARRSLYRRNSAMCSMIASNARASPGSWSGASCPNSGRTPDLRPADYFSSYQATYLERDVPATVERVFAQGLRPLHAGQRRTQRTTPEQDRVGEGSGNQQQDGHGVAERSSGIQSDHVDRAVFHQCRQASHQKRRKLYFNDVGLLCFLLGLNQRSVTDSYLIGSIWETLVFAELRKYLSATAPEASIWFYRDQSP